MHSLPRKNIEYLSFQHKVISLPGFLFVLIVHAGILYILWNQRLIPQPEQLVTVFSELIMAPSPTPITKTAPSPPIAKPQTATKPPLKPKQERMVAKSAAIPEQESVATPPDKTNALENDKSKALDSTASSAAPAQTDPVTLSSELSVFCQKLTAPIYPPMSRRLGEEGNVELHVELDEKGRIDGVRINRSSGYERLDAAALAALKNWRCSPSLRNGQPVRAVALQPFNFVLQGNQ